ncbi:indolepyruvate ferredoxin oxidoreductase [Myxococcota bacterium]|nr:indolepyruvate ferredoxin oxidoreductase [Myxococcota bacterium]MBU1537980.1 indolepyruvate ferredoxin oxidoreductase [Myxococcota bacterium]
MEAKLSDKKQLLLGDEAIAQGAIDAGASGFYAYPGTPSTEILEYVQRSRVAQEKGIHSQWSANEKTAVEAGLGMSYAGKRTMACMKHVGLNVAADSFVNSGITGANGGYIIVSADDPSMHSSQNEQDSRFYGKFAFMPVLEPSSQQEAYDMCFYGFDFSEKYKIPVLMRITTRLAHSRSGVELKDPREPNSITLPEDARQFVLLPAISRRRYKKLLETQSKFIEESNNSPYNKYIEAGDKKRGIIACGLGYNYVMENYPDGCPHPILKICQYPLPDKLIKRMAEECEEILVVEEGMPLVEEQLRGFMNAPLTIRGRLDGTLSRDGELNPNMVRVALGMDSMMGDNVPDLVKSRPPAFCVGCGHIDFFKALNEAVKDKHGDGHVFSDIGCYTLAAQPPFESINSCVDMGASITMAKGAADAGLFPSIAVIGDSTFTHSGITGLLDCAIESTNIVVCILDNSTTAMTGGQNSHASGRVRDICLGLGINPEHIRECVPLPKNHEELVKIINEEVAYEGVSVVVPTRECVQTIGKKPKKQ